MTLTPALRRVLPEHTAATWQAIVDVLPDEAYLIGGTALAVHLAHRRSQDLDFCLEGRVDLRRLRDDLAGKGVMTVDTLIDHPLQTLNLFFSPWGSTVQSTKLQFLDGTRLRAVDDFRDVAGLRIAGIGDLLASKLSAIIGRAALRDYHDLMAIETVAHRRVEEGLALYLERYQPSEPEQSLRTIIDALSSFSDLEADPALIELTGGRQVGIEEIAHYWAVRVPEIVAHLDVTE